MEWNSASRSPKKQESLQSYVNFWGFSNNVVAPLELTSAPTWSEAHRLGTTAVILSSLTFTLRITMFNVQKFYVLLTKFIYVCSVVSVYSCNWLVFLTGSEFVYFVTQTVFKCNSQRKSNKMQQYINILFHIYVKLNMFRATYRPSSGA